MIDTVFFDVGGVLLTNGWDRHGRAEVIQRFGLDPDEFGDRHQFVVHDFEIGAIDLATYLKRTVFYRPRDFTPDEFVAAMKALSRPLPGGLELVDELRATGVRLAILNNESRELNDHRIRHCGLRERFQMFLSSCYLGVKKPEPEIYRRALDISQADPARSLFVDDRLLNIECAADEGLPGIHFRGIDALRADLVSRGVLAA